MQSSRLTAVIILIMAVIYFLCRFIASHIKPWAASDNKEKVDPYNGYMLTPLYDKLFDRGFITFTENRHLILSDFISPLTWKKLGIKNDVFVQNLLMDDKRIEYLKFHQQSVFKGTIDEWFIIMSLYIPKPIYWFWALGGGFCKCHK